MATILSSNRQIKLQTQKKQRAQRVAEVGLPYIYERINISTHPLDGILKFLNKTAK